MVYDAGADISQGGLSDSQSTKLVAQEVDQELLDDHEFVARIFEDERENNNDDLPELTVDQWNEIYEEVTQDMNKMLALQLIEDQKHYDHEADYELNQMFSELAIEQ